MSQTEFTKLEQIQRYSSFQTLLRNRMRSILNFKYYSIPPYYEPNWLYKTWANSTLQYSFQTQKLFNVD